MTFKRCVIEPIDGGFRVSLIHSWYQLWEFPKYLQEFDDLILAKDWALNHPNDGKFITEKDLCIVSPVGEKISGSYLYVNENNTIVDDITVVTNTKPIQKTDTTETSKPKPKFHPSKQFPPFPVESLSQTLDRLLKQGDYANKCLADENDESDAFEDDEYEMIAEEENRLNVSRIDEDFENALKEYIMASDDEYESNDRESAEVETEAEDEAKIEKVEEEVGVVKIISPQPIKLNFNHPIKELVWCTPDDADIPINKTVYSGYKNLGHVGGEPSIKEGTKDPRMITQSIDESEVCEIEDHLSRKRISKKAARAKKLKQNRRSLALNKRQSVICKNNRIKQPNKGRRRKRGKRQRNRRN